jgi:hypothetical protein
MNRHDCLPIDIAQAWRQRGADLDWPTRAVRRFRDLLLLRHGALVTVIACDSNAGIGDRPADVLRQPGRLTGFGAAKVPLMEVLAAGASPIVLVNNLSCSLDGPGREVLAGIQDCVRLSGHHPVITGSDETNIPTTQSGVGITVIGIADADGLLLGKANAGDLVVVVGQPMDGLHVPYEETDSNVVTPADVSTIVSSGLVHEVLPVGSKGIGYEAGELARTGDLKFTARRTNIDLSLSAGSSTCVLLACTADTISELTELTAHPLTIVGSLEP